MLDKKEKMKAYKEANKEKIKQQAKIYYQNNKEKIKEKQKTYQNFNKEKIKEQQKSFDRKTYNKLYKEANKEKIKEQQKGYVEANKEKIKEQQKTYIGKYDRENYRKEYNLINKNKIKEQQKEYIKNRIKTDSLFNLKCSIRSNISQSFKKTGFKKITRTEQILGCTFKEFYIYLESLFEYWMTWENKGNPKDGILELNKTWDIDHIIPTSTAKNEFELLKLNHYTNLQPLCSYTNRLIKKDNIILP